MNRKLESAIGRVNRRAQADLLRFRSLCSRSALHHSIPLLPSAQACSMMLSLAAERTAARSLLRTLRRSNSAHADPQ